MLLTDGSGVWVRLRVVGYQCPLAEDPEKRFSWHQIEGAAADGDESWGFAFPALTCDETFRITGWLRLAAKGLRSAPPDLRFTEPNLGLRVAGASAADGRRAIEVTLGQEFARPRDRLHSPRRSTVLSIAMTPQALVGAAEDWELEASLFPNGAASDPDGSRRPLSSG
jgi:hypothetical protein